jgi:hypothetical protein
MRWVHCSRNQEDFERIVFLFPWFCTDPFRKNQFFYMIHDLFFEKVIFCPIILIFYHKKSLVSSNLWKKQRKIKSKLIVFWILIDNNLKLYIIKGRKLFLLVDSI